jgi:uncharacterized protein
MRTPFDFGDKATYVQGERGEVKCPDTFVLSVAQRSRSILFAILTLARSFFFALFFIQVALAEVAVPPLTAHVTDLTNTLDSSQVQSLDTQLAEFEKTKGAQLAVLMLPTTQPETIEQYSLRVVEQWKLGRKKVDDGALLIIAKDDRKMRIEVGYGLEGALNDATAKRIISEVITPPFKQGNFAAGVEAGLQSMMQVVGGEPLPPPVAQQRSKSGPNFETMIALTFILVVVVGGVLRTVLGRLPAAGLVGGIAGGVAWWILMPVFGAVAVGVAAFVLSLLSGTARNAGSFLSGRGGFGGDVFTGGGSGSSWGGGGGGGFGGGGASGGW